TTFLRQFRDQLSVDGDAPDPRFVEGGYLFLATSAGLPVLQQNHQTQQALGADIALLSTNELARRYPWLTTDDLAGGSVGLSGEGWLDASAMMYGMRRKALAGGVVYLHDRVIDVIRSDSTVTGVVLQQTGHISCDIVVNAAGTGAAAIARQAGIALPV